jgi:hypothetical protein
VSIASGNGKKVRLLTRDNLDQRTRACKLFDATVRHLVRDMGGDPSTVQRCLAEAFAGQFLIVTDINSRLKLGEKIDITEQSVANNCLVRIAARLPDVRVPKDVTPTLDQYLASKEAAE